MVYISLIIKYDNDKKWFPLITKISKYKPVNHLFIVLTEIEFINAKNKQLKASIRILFDNNITEAILVEEGEICDIGSKENEYSLDHMINIYCKKIKDFDNEWEIINQSDTLTRGNIIFIKDGNGNKYEITNETSLLQNIITGQYLIETFYKKYF